MKKMFLLAIVFFNAKNIMAQNVGIGNTAPLMNLHVTSTDSAVVLLENSQALNTNIKNALYFKTGSGSFPYTGAIKTTGESTSAARLGLFTFASTSPNQLLERLSITDVGNVGIGTTSPVAKLHVANSNVLFTAAATLPASPAAPPLSGAGNRMFWYADKAAFRAGGVNDNSWDQANIGLYSFAGGFNSMASADNTVAFGGGNANAGAAIAIGFACVASGFNATAIGSLSHALGNSSTALNGGYSSGYGSFSVNGTAGGSNSFSANLGNASGNFSIAFGSGCLSSNTYSIAMGQSTNASGANSVAFGKNTTASNAYSTAMGESTTASGTNATAMGYNSMASGSVSTTFGNGTIASGTVSTALGANTTASGDYSTAIGKDVSTNNFDGSLIIGDASASSVSNCVRANEFRARFAGGYAFYTSSLPISGVYMINGSNAWSTISDSTKKEKFKKADGEYVLNSISKMRLGTWNYKQQNAKTFRHYGPMAQEFYAAFGNDGIGKIGSDTLINSADIDGVMMIGLQALEKRSSALAMENQTLKENNIAMQKELDLVKREYAKKNEIVFGKLALMEIKINELLAMSQNNLNQNIPVSK